jgi:hypothetical protein
MIAAASRQHAAVVFLLFALVSVDGRAARDTDVPPYGDAFWRIWGDGQGEIAVYRGTRARYGETRDTELVVITVTEDFSAQKRVKSSRTPQASKDVFPVVKLNVSERFTTGIYDYALMTSAFVSLSSDAGVARGTPAKVSFSAQEWCGHVYHQVLFDEKRARESLHSYFEGEEDRLSTLPHPDGGVVEDTLLLWARGLAAPALGVGETRHVPFLPALRHARLAHVPLAWTTAQLTVKKESERITVPLGTFDAEVREVVLATGRRLRFFVEREGARRVLRFDDGEDTAALTAITRTPYWQKNANAFVPLRATLGLDTPGASLR